jgi:hypothetical protein
LDPGSIDGSEPPGRPSAEGIFARDTITRKARLIAGDGNGARARIKLDADDETQVKCAVENR